MELLESIEFYKQNNQYSSMKLYINFTIIIFNYIKNIYIYFKEIALDFILQ